MTIKVSDKEKELYYKWIGYTLDEGFCNCERPEEYAKETIAAISLAEKLFPDYTWFDSIHGGIYDIKGLKQHLLELMDQAIREAEEDEEYYVDLAKEAIKLCQDVF